MKKHSMRKLNGKHYTSLQELGLAMGIKPSIKRTKDAEKLASQQEAFCGKHKCKGCGQPMQWVAGTNVMRCVNPSCRGIKYEYEDADGNKQIGYKTSFGLLDTLGAEIASNIFS